jgi:hypothetical protein
VSCGASGSARPDPAAPPAPSADVATDAPAGSAAGVPAEAPAPPAPASPPFPTACADKTAEVCTPPSDYVDRLCTRPHQDAALALFAKAMPFTRLYLRGKMDELAFDEEVLALRYHPVPKNGIQVGSSTGSYDVLRWDGSCSRAVESEMLTKSRPPRPRAAKVQWHRLGDSTQNALVSGSEALKKAHAWRGKECRGAMSGEVSSGCEKADESLVTAIVEYVRGGGAVPKPDSP